ncbi:MAG: CopG family transcriptional regulator, partial [Gemmatimonadota bacterium]|nr:CopG family transcriptional regulator [Gemmatimonadota bacterium]
MRGILDESGRRVASTRSANSPPDIKKTNRSPALLHGVGCLPRPHAPAPGGTWHVCYVRITLCYMKDAHLTLRLPADLAALLDRRARERDTGRSQLVREAVAG